MSAVGNVAIVARREFSVRVRTRSFVFGTILLVIGVLVIGLAPIIIRAFDQTSQVHVAVYAGASNLQSDPARTLTTLLNPTSTDATAAPGSPPDYLVSTVSDLGAARQQVIQGQYAAVLEIERSPAGDLTFKLYTNDNATGRTAELIRQASNSIAIGDRLLRLGVQPAAQQGLFSPADFGVAWPDPARTDPTHGTTELLGQDMLAFGMTILIFMMIIMYGTWIAMSVVEEKSSRVMEVILNAATPFQLLTGKVLGVGAVALSQYGALLLAGIVAVVGQGPVSALVLGSTTDGAAALPEGLTIQLLLVFGVYGVLGFLLFAVLYAAAGSLVSRQEDVNAAVMPMTLVSTAGYMVGVYAATGLLDSRAGWLVALGQVPLVSPFMMLGRVATGQAALWEIVLSVTLLLVSIVGALWLAARIYAAGVLMYGQRPSLRAVTRLVLAGG